MNAEEYKKYHEEHMMNNVGTSVEECCLLLSTIPFCAFLSSHLVSHISGTVIFFFEFSVVILPAILNVTIFSDVHHLVFLNALLLSVALIVVYTDMKNMKKTLNTKLESPKAFISNFRASTNFVSAICILAVDFKVFPKRYTKTESFGFGFMDLGVGFFICSNGFVEKHWVSEKPFSKLLKTEAVLCALGLIRIISVKSIDYHEHVSEYGVHWNFFFTLALCRFLSYVILRLTNNGSPLYLSIVIGVIHQLLLLMGLQQWVLIDKPRNSFLTANREGLVSCFGYISLYFASSAVGRHILHAKSMTYRKVLIKLFITCLITWLATGVSFEIVGVSRRLVNLGYIFWILSLGLMELFLFALLQVFLLSVRKKGRLNVISPVPSILECVNRYGLLYFIISNLLTGLVNLIFQTLLVGKIKSMIIIISYMILLSGATYSFQIRNIVSTIKS